LSDRLHASRRPATLCPADGRHPANCNSNAHTDGSAQPYIIAHADTFGNLSHADAHAGHPNTNAIGDCRHADAVAHACHTRHADRYRVAHDRAKLNAQPYAYCHQPTATTYANA
jgi:hypothetical protein